MENSKRFIAKPIEIIHTASSTETVFKAESSNMEKDEVAEVLAQIMGGKVAKNSSKKTSTLGINYDHPNSSTYFRDKGWNPSNN